MAHLEQLMNKHGVTATKECNQVITSSLQEYPKSNSFSLSQKIMFHTDYISRTEQIISMNSLIRIQNAVLMQSLGNLMK